MYRPDETLVEQTLSGDEDAFSMLVRKYQGMVCGLAYHKIGNFEDAHELAQEAFINAYRDLHRLQEPEKFSHWLYSIALNTCISWLRKRRLPIVSLESEACEREFVDTSPTPEENILAEEERDFIHNAMANLPDSHRLAITLYYMDGLSVDEVGRFLDIPPGTVKSRLHKGRKLLKEELMAMVEQGFAEHRPGDEFAAELRERIDVVLAESTEILTSLLRKSVPDAAEIQQIKSMVERFAATPSTDTKLDNLWEQIFDSITKQDREIAFNQVMQMLYQSADMGAWGWQLCAIAALDLLKMAEEDIERKPDDINILMGYMVGQVATGGRFEWRGSSWRCMSWGDIGFLEEIYRSNLKIPVEHLEIGTSWFLEMPMFRDDGNLYETTVEADNDVVTVPAGRFENCLRVSIVASSRRLGKKEERQIRKLWMAPGVGLVKSTIQVLKRPEHNREIVLKNYFVPDRSQDYFPLQIGCRWHYEWDDACFRAPTAEVYRLLCQKGEEFYFSRARYIYGNYADSEVGKMVAAERKKEQKDKAKSKS